MTTPVDLSYELSGPPAAPAVVLASSLATTLSMWDPQLPALTPWLQVVRYDHRGHGGSPVPPGPYRIADLAADVLALLDRLALPRVSFCGLSLGGMVGIYLAAHAPDRVERLVLCCTTGTLPAAPWTARAESVRTDGTAPLAEETTGRWLTAEFRRRDPEASAAVREQVARTPAEGYAACCEALAGLDLHAELARIRADTLVLAGSDDPGLPPPHGQAIVDGIRAGGGVARLQVIPRAAHLANLEQPELVNQLLLQHLTASAPAAPA